MFHAAALKAPKPHAAALVLYAEVGVDCSASSVSAVHGWAAEKRTPTCAAWFAGGEGFVWLVETFIGLLSVFRLGYAFPRFKLQRQRARCSLDGATFAVARRGL
jgi:hypothetical protein